MLSNSNAVIRTVSGDVPASSLGIMQCHEHIYLRKGPSYDSNPALCMDDYERSLRELKIYAEAGGRAIVDAQPGFFGRDSEMLRCLSMASGVQIVAVTGFHKLTFAEKESPLQSMSEKEAAEFFYQELTEGMTGIGGKRVDARAGIVKTAFEKGGLEHPIYRKLFQAAAEAAAEAGTSVMVHTEKNTDILELVDFFEKNGVCAKRLLICHLDRTHYDPEYHRSILARGCTLCYDSVHRLKYLTDEQEIQLIRDVWEAGYGGQIVLSLDTTNERLRSYNGKDMGLDYILTQYIPLLKDAGFKDGQIQQMICENAASILQIRQ